MKKTNVIKFASLALLLGSFVGLAGVYKNTQKVELLKDSTELTEEFKQILIELGMPEWFFEIRKFKSYNC